MALVMECQCKEWKEKIELIESAIENFQDHDIAGRKGNKDGPCLTALKSCHFCPWCGKPLKVKKATINEATSDIKGIE